MRRVFSLRQWLAAALAATSCVVGTAHAEGSVQVGLGSTDPAQPFNQFLFDYNVTNTFIKTPTRPIYVDIRNANEVINISLCGSADSDPLKIEIYNSSGTNVANFVPTATEGKVLCNSTLSAPITTAYKYTAPTTGTYEVRLFNNVTGTGTERHFKRFDITVTPNASTSPDPRINGGRVWAYSWAFNGNNQFLDPGATDADYFVRVPGGRSSSEYIWKLDLNRFAGQRYEIIANAIGLNAPNSGYSTDGTSSATAKWPIYLSYPTNVQAPPTAAPVISNFRFENAGGRNFISPGTTVGVNDSGNFKFTSDADGTYAIVIDANKDGIYGAQDRLLLGTTAANTETTVAWDGKDAAGNVLNVGDYTAQLSVRLGEYHFVAFDVETSGGGSSNGLTVYRATSQTGTANTQVYWDDFTKLSAAGGTTNLPGGGTSGTAAGRHTWGNFATGSLGDTRYIDTYVYGLSTTSLIGARITNGDAIVTGKVYNDTNVDGSAGTGEPGLSGVTVELVNSSAAVVATTTTAADGSYSFSGLSAGTYTVRVVSNAALGTRVAVSPAPAQRSVTLTTTTSAGNDFGFAPGVDLGIAKTGPSVVGAGASFSYVLTLTNAGPSAAGGATFTDNVPSGITGVTATCRNASAGVSGCSASVGAGNVVTGSVTSFPSGGSVEILITGTAPSTGSLSNQATIAFPSGTTETNTGNNTSSIVTTLIVDARNDPDATFTVGSIGSGIVDVLSNDLIGTTTVTAATGNVTIFANGGLTNLSVNGSDQLVVPTTAAAGTYNVTYQLCDATVATACDTATVKIVIAALLPPTISKAFGPTSVSVGGVSTITFTLSNPNASALTNLNFTDTLTGMRVSSTIIGGTCTGVTNNPALAVGATSLNLTVPNLGGNASCTVTVQIAATGVGSLPNTTSGVTSTQTTVVGNASNTAILTVDFGTCENVYSVGATSGNAELRAVNTSTGLMSSVVSTLGSGSFAAARTLNRVYYLDTSSSNATLRYLDAATGTSTIAASGISNGGTFTRMAIRSDGTGFAVDTNAVLYSFTTSGTTSTVTSLGKLTSASIADLATYGSGDIAFDNDGKLWAVMSDGGRQKSFLFQIDVTNRVAYQVGQIVLTSSPTTILVFNGLAFDSQGNLYASDDNTNSIYKIDPGTAQAVLLGNNSAARVQDLASCVYPVVRPNVAVTKTVNKASVAPDKPLSYTITVTNPLNPGNAGAAGIVITDTLPANVTLVSATGNPTQVGNVLTWRIDGLLSNASQSFTVNVTAPNQATVDANNITQIVNTATTTLFSTNRSTLNPATATSKIMNLQLKKWVRNITTDFPKVNGAPTYSLGDGSVGNPVVAVKPNDVLEYCIDFTNVGGANLSNIKIVDATPANTYVVADSLTLTVDGVSQTVPVGALTSSGVNLTAVASPAVLAPGKSGRVCFRVKVY